MGSRPGALAETGALDDVEALSVGGQQEGLVCLDEDGEVVRAALPWNDVRFADAPAALDDELGDGDGVVGAQRWAEDAGSVPVASFTITKVGWFAGDEPANADRVAPIALPHDWLTWRLAEPSLGLLGIYPRRPLTSNGREWR